MADVWEDRVDHNIDDDSYNSGSRRSASPAQAHRNEDRATSSEVVEEVTALTSDLRDQRSDDRQTYSLFVSGLHDRITDDEFKELFGQYGEIDNVNIMRDPHSKETRGFGFVTFTENRGAEEALQNLNGVEHGGKQLQIEVAKRNRPRTPTPGRYYGPTRGEGGGGRGGGGAGRGYAPRFDDRRPPSRPYGGGRYYDRRRGGPGHDDRARPSDNYREREPRGRHDGRSGGRIDDRGGYGRYDDYDRRDRGYPERSYPDRGGYPDYPDRGGYADRSGGYPDRGGYRRPPAPASGSYLDSGRGAPAYDDRSGAYPPDRPRYNDRSFSGYDSYQDRAPPSASSSAATGPGGANSAYSAYPSDRDYDRREHREPREPSYRRESGGYDKYAAAGAGVGAGSSGNSNGVGRSGGPPTAPASYDRPYEYANSRSSSDYRRYDSRR
ncbi:hypothetical protein V1514DRAFT_318296 [Lipomyces japonicus]|uniref:uncharacterized protein n=1 Tax=Lipomyces japonicus TaxID=56871 RepID=UPI0034CF7D5C